jgi:hypothetical protein
MGWLGPCQRRTKGTFKGTLRKDLRSWTYLDTVENDTSPATKHGNEYWAWINEICSCTLYNTRVTTICHDSATTHGKGPAYAVTCNNYLPGSAKKMPYREISAVSLIGLYHILYATFAPDFTLIDQ